MLIPSNLTTTISSIALIKILLMRSKKSMAGIPLRLDLRISPLTNSKSKLASPSKVFEVAPSKSLSFHETPFVGDESTIILVTESSLPSLKWTFLVVQSAKESSPTLVRTSDRDSTSFILFFLNYIIFVTILNSVY
ncbi:hypothetical protein ES288_A05G286900v1 [Gossypium darwinii]|uniref:Uncharacterized protein n=1 Tax=Gossypium darwinii TaxID=34276 RepID=A0A5D2GKG7_GOSDA|nr:hypothetical protein ES288_A05G286900v1 [Gossypium darwinii]